MRQDQFDTIRQRLLTLREQYLSTARRNNTEAAALQERGVPDIGDLSRDDSAGELLHLLGDVKRLEILQIDEALQRMREGTYGTCRQCGEEIDPDRLALRPYALLCVACKSRLERQEEERSGPGRGTL